MNVGGYLGKFNRRFYASIMATNNMIFSLQGFVFTDLKHIMIENVFEHGFELHNSLNTYKSKSLYNYIFTKLLDDYNNLVTESIEDEICLDYSRIYLVFYDVKPKFKDGCIDIQDILYYVRIDEKDLKELTLRLKNSLYTDLNFLHKCIEDYSNKIIFDILEAFILKYKDEYITNSFYFNIIIPRNKNTNFYLENKEGNIKFNFKNKTNAGMCPNDACMHAFFRQVRSYSTLNIKEKIVYKTTNSGSVTSKSVTSYNTRNLDNPANDFSVIQSLGIDPKHIAVHNMIIRDNKPLSWSYGSWNYYDAGDVKKITQKSIQEYMKDCINQNGVTYAIIPVIYDATQSLMGEYVSVTGQLILTNLVDPKELYNSFKLGIQELSKKYMKEKKDIVGEVVFKFRPISYDNNVYNKILSIPNYKIIQNYTHLKTFNSSLEGFDIIPLTLDLNKYGQIINNEFIYNDVKQLGTHYLYKPGIIIFVHDSDIIGKRKLTIFKNNVIKFRCIDTFNEDNDIFTREMIGGIDGFKLFINNSTNKILYSEVPIQCKSIKKGKIDLVKDEKISAMDIETYLDSNKIFTPYACAFARYDNSVKNYYLNDFKDQRDMFKNCIIDMLSDELGLGTVYIHNLSKFDLYFLNDVLKNDKDISSNYKMNKNGKILSINVSFKNKKQAGRFILRDSLLLMPSDLRNLTKKFGAINEKLYFPHRFVQKDNLNYIGIKPDLEYYDYDEDDKDEFIKLKDYYNNIKSNNWNLKEELLKYLEYDVKGLQQVIKKFSDDIWKLEHLNVTNTPTCSSLAFKALKTNYLDNNILYQVKGGAHENMRRAYFGGISEVYNLKAENGVRIYDINSSYPASMKQTMPIGKPVFSSDPGGLDNYFGVVYTKIETPKNSKGEYRKLDYPPLPFRLPDGNIINPIGKWEGWYSTVILNYVRDVWGYKTDVKFGYKFNKGEHVFEKFVDKYYNIKAGKAKDLDINRDTSKLMLNSGYGRMGLKLDDVETKFTTSDESKLIQQKYQVIDVIQFTPEIDWIKFRRQLNNSFIWSTITKNSDQNPKYSNAILRIKEDDTFYDIEQSLPIAIFTAAYSTIRLFEGIRKVKDSGGIIYAVDTDSIHTDGYLPEDCIGNELGQWKLERETKGVGLYPLPKVYFVEDDEDGKVKDIKKGKGVKKKSITKEEYLKLTQGESIEKKENRFKIIKKEFRIKLEKTKICLNAELNKRIPVKNSYTTNPLTVIDGEVKYTTTKNKRP